MNGMPPNLHGYIIGTSIKVDEILATLTSFSGSQEDFAFIPNKLAQLYLKDNLKSLLYFGDLDPIFKVTSQQLLTKVDFIAKNEILLEQLD